MSIVIRNKILSWIEADESALKKSICPIEQAELKASIIYWSNKLRG